MQETPAARVRSIDALRGFDMFWIIGGQELVLGIVALLAPSLLAVLQRQASHAQWEGFTAEDAIMPLFLFIVGAAMPFSFGRRMDAGQSKAAIYGKVIRRVLVLWVLGMVAQGNLLALDISKLHVFSNTLQAIALGYLVAAILLMHVPRWGQVLAALLLMGGYWVLMKVVSFDGQPAGTMQPEANLARYIDHMLLGRFGDGTTYGWILPSMNYAANVLLGVFAGHLLRSVHTPARKLAGLVLLGLGCLAAGWIVAGGPVALLNRHDAVPQWAAGLCDAIWRARFPMNKHLVTTSMVLWAGGWCYLMMALFYLVIDVWGFSAWALPFTVIGANAIVAYMLAHPFCLKLATDGYVDGLAKLAKPHGALVQTAAAFAALWLILFMMYRRKVFVRV
jgi:predicted acyltransferase